MLSLLLALAQPAQGAGYYMLDAGVRAFSRGGAWVVGADDISAMYYNPAALIRTEGVRARVDVAAVSQYISFDRADVDGDPVTNQGRPYVIPTMGVSWDMGTERWAVALGFYPPYAPDFLYPADGPQRYTLIDSTVIQTAAGPSVAFRAHPWITLGAGLQWQLLTAGQDLMLTTSGEDDPDSDIRFSVLATDRFAISGNLGLLVEAPSGFWGFGAAVQLPTRFTGTGELTGDFSNHVLHERGIITSGVVVDPEVTLAIRMPMTLRAGALVRPVEGLEVELSGVWQGWDSIDEIVVDDIELTVQSTLGPTIVEGPVVLPASYVNAWSARLGGSYVISDRWTARAGAFYESSAVTEQTLGVNLVDAPKLGYGLGGSATFGRYTLDAGWSQAFLAKQTVKNSQVSQIHVDVFTGDVDEVEVVGNGEYRSRQSVFGAALDVAFGLPKD
ncbi:MAG: outer membrane protein transport protein [Alphaproteobacteria bacterium]|nr:outer membrane protein transport protein [Alphaproteobacteria bacterium]MCB9793406.1 outer membrane protein transport protein [Alphaproteobacteria bacterium]